MKIAAAVVTYNRKEDLIKNINEILNQKLKIDKYYIIDNHGSDNTKDALEKKGILKNKIINYVYLPENIGGSGGFYTALKMAYDDGYDYVCLMDDDGRPYNEKMMSSIVDIAKNKHKENELILLNSLVLSKDKYNLSFGLKDGIKTLDDVNNAKNKENLIIDTINPFNGTLVSRELIDKIGFPNKDFFIKGDEQDFFVRALNVGAYVATVCDSLYFHPKLERKKIRILWKTFYASSESPWKEYYRARNYTYMFKRDKKYQKAINQNIKQILWAVILNNKKWETIKMILKGWNDGKKGKLGPTVRP